MLFRGPGSRSLQGVLWCRRPQRRPCTFVWKQNKRKLGPGVVPPTNGSSPSGPHLEYGPGVVPPNKWKPPERSPPRKWPGSGTPNKWKPPERSPPRKWPGSGTPNGFMSIGQQNDPTGAWKQHGGKVFLLNMTLSEVPALEDQICKPQPSCTYGAWADMATAAKRLTPQ